MTTTFTILVVCTGNVCRSPAVEALLTSALGPSSGIVVGSAGTAALVGQPITDPMATLLSSADAEPKGHRARTVTRDLLARADLVLAVTRAHRAALVEMYPSGVRRTFTLREFARLASDVDPAQLPPGPPGERLAALVPLAAAQRGLAPVIPADDDVVDPYRGSSARYRTSFDQLRPAAETIASQALGDAARSQGTPG